MYHFLFIGHSSVFSNFDILSPGNQLYYIVIMEPHNKIASKVKANFSFNYRRITSNWNVQLMGKENCHFTQMLRAFAIATLFAKVPIVSNLKNCSYDCSFKLYVHDEFFFFFNATITFIPKVFLIYNAKMMKIVEKIPSTNNNFCNSHSFFFTIHRMQLSLHR